MIALTKTKKHSNIKGFTLIEILIVIAIIGLLIGVISVNFAAGNKKARDTRRQVDLEQVRAALQLYYANNGSYPAPAGCTVSFCNISSLDNSTYLSNYWDKRPVEPYYTGSGSCTATETNCPYRYIVTNPVTISGTTYYYGYCLEARYEVTTGSTNCSVVLAPAGYNLGVRNP